MLYGFYGDLVTTRLLVNTRLETKSKLERVESYEDSWRLIKSHWLFGTGIGNYTQTMREELASDRPSYFYQPAHNTFLLIFAETGIFGLLFFVGLLACLLKKELSSQLGTKFLCGLPILLALITMMMFDHWWWSLHFGILFFWLLMGLIIRERCG